MNELPELIRLDLTEVDSPTIGRDFVAAMGRYPSGVTVVATDGAAGRLGQTATAVMSLCADPPSLAIGLFRGVPVADAIYSNKCFSVSVLSVDDVAVANDFAGQADVSTRYRFDQGWRTVRTGSPVRVDSPAWFDCHAEHFLVVGTHLLIVGRVVAAASAPATGLSYAARQYGRHVDLDAKS